MNQARDEHDRTIGRVHLVREDEEKSEFIQRRTLRHLLEKQYAAQGCEMIPESVNQSRE
jgi:hypothetical protein